MIQPECLRARGKARMPTPMRTLVLLKMVMGTVDSPIIRSMTSPSGRISCSMCSGPRSSGLCSSDSSASRARRLASRRCSMRIEARRWAVGVSREEMLPWLWPRIELRMLSR